MTNRDRRVAALREQGYTWAEIGEVIGVGERQVGRILKNLEMTRDRFECTEEQRQLIRTLSEDEGWPPEEICETLGLSRSIVYRWYTPGAGREWAVTARILATRYPKLWYELRA